MRKKLKDICDFYSGTGFPTQYQGETEGDYPFYKVGDIAQNAVAGKVYLELCNNYISEEVAKTIKGCILPKNTVVFAKIGEALKLNRRAITSCDCLIDNNVMGIAPKSDFLRIQYFYFFMKNLKIQTLAESTTVPSVRKTVLENYEIEVPSLDEQKEIENKFAFAQKIIEKRKQELSTLDNLIKARFVEMFGDIYLNSKGWSEAKLESMADVVSGITKGRKTKSEDLTEVPYMAVSNVKDGYIDWTTVKTIEATQQEIEQYRLLADDVLMTEGGDPDKVGRGAIIKEPLENCIHQNHIFRVRLDESVMLPEFFAEYLQHQRSKRYFLGCAKQTTGIASINMTQLRALPVLMPPLSKQEEFVLFKAQVDKSKVVVQKALTETQLLFDSFMQQYFG